MLCFDWRPFDKVCVFVARTQIFLHFFPWLWRNEISSYLFLTFFINLIENLSCFLEILLGGMDGLECHWFQCSQWKELKEKIIFCRIKFFRQLNIFLNTFRRNYFRYIEVLLFWRIKIRVNAMHLLHLKK